MAYPNFQVDACTEVRDDIVKDYPVDQRHLAPGYPATPEEVVLQMSLAEVQELLADVRLTSDVMTAQRLQRLVRELGRFELAIDAIGGPAKLGNCPKKPQTSDVRRAA